MNPLDLRRTTRNPLSPPATPLLLQFCLDWETLLTLVNIGNKNGVGPELVNVHWNGVNISTVNWQSVRVLGDEYWAKQRKYRDGTVIDRARRFRYFQDAVRANRQLANMLRAQGLNEDADRFAYRAQLLQRGVLRRQHRYLRLISSWFLDLVSGYGYRPLRSLLTYIVVILGFAVIYFFLGGTSGQVLSWNEAIVVSMTAFHGRASLQRFSNLATFKRRSRLSKPLLACSSRSPSSPPSRSASLPDEQ